MDSKMNFEESIAAYLDGELSIEDRKNFEKILNSDKKYKTKLNEVVSLIDDLKQMPKLSTSSNFSSQLQAKIDLNSRPQKKILDRIKSVFFKSKPALNFSASFAAIAIFAFLYLNDLDVFSSKLGSVDFTKSKNQNSEYFDIELAGGFDEDIVEDELELLNTEQDTVDEDNNDLKFNLKGIFDSLVNQVNVKKWFKDEE